MRCPFLREAQVKFCQASPYRKMIVRLPEQSEEERCSSAEYRTCPAAKQHCEERPSLTHCPFLQESLVQYCTAASVAKYIPYSDSPTSSCGSGSHRYCELFLAIARPGTRRDAVPEEAFDASMAEAFHAPDALWYSPNHLWLDIGSDGTLHVGIDGFMARILGAAQQLTFMNEAGRGRPTVVASVCGVDLTIVFPHEVTITRTNVYVRSDPSRLVKAPYTRGWLFEGSEEKGQHHRPLTDGLRSGTVVARWMKEEARRLSALIQEFSLHGPHHQQPALLADGGMPSHPLPPLLTREEILHLYHEFFSPLATWRSLQ